MGLSCVQVKLLEQTSRIAAAAVQRLPQVLVYPQDGLIDSFEFWKLPLGPQIDFLFSFILFFNFFCLS